MNALIRPLALLGALVVALPLTALAEPPVIAPGECLYLVGAPPGAPAAATEERVAGSSVETGCNLPHGVDLNRDGENMIQAWVTRDPAVPFSEAVCLTQGWIGHAFQLAPEAGGPAAAWVSVSGSYVGRLENRVGGTYDGSDAELAIRLLEAYDGARTMVAERTIDKHELLAKGPIDPGGGFSVRLSAGLHPGRAYSVEFVLRLDAENDVRLVDFGEPGSDRWARYDSIEVCVAPAFAGGTAGDDSLERDLHDGRCMPGLWMPAAAGGRVEEARDLVALRLSQASSTGDAGVNEHVAARRLAEADARLADGEYQAACRSLAQGLRALTTP